MVQWEEKERLFRRFQIMKFDKGRRVPAVSMTVDIEMDKLLELRSEANATREASLRISLTHLFMKASAKTLLQFPLLYASFDGKKIVDAKEMVFNIPVDVENHVEYVVLHSPDKKGLDEIVKDSREQVERIQRGEGEFYLYLKRFMRIPAFIRKLAMRFPSRSIDFLQKRYGNFVITNFGSFGVAGGVPTMSMPMIAVLTLGAMQERAVRDAAGQCVFRNFIPVTLLFDHRPIDGAYGGRFLAAMRESMEQRPEALFGE
jgi:pyruvate/2-oxoglutarate dehydrogenase complex dihydrolipoamide acyltransferase (E2) component